MSSLSLKKSKLLIFLTLFTMLVCVVGCDNGDDGAGFTPGGGDGDSDTDTDTDTDIDADADGNADVNGDGIIDNKNAYTGDNCNRVLWATVRDFKASHPDFEVTIVNDIWPDAVVRNWLSPTLGADKKPVWSNNGAQYQVTTGANGEWTENPLNWVEMEFWPASTPNPTPLAFHEWYNDVEGVNIAVEKGIVLTPTADESMSYVDNPAFFPLLLTDGFGNESGQTDGDGTTGNPRNFLFTTEIHTSFEYKGGEIFSFRGDDDLWIYVNGKLAMDLGGLHQPANGTIDFDASATELGLTIGETYDLDIFHAERHTNSSNFKVETTIQCFIPIIE